jgi:hypothetical protein
MAMRPDSHEIFARRRSRNVGVGIALGAFVLLIFAVTLVKLFAGMEIQGYDHSFESLPQDGIDR